MRRGIDSSDYQGNINWPAVVASGVSFAIIKATQGTRNVQDTFLPHRDQAPAAGIGLLGLYHFAQDGDPVAQADHFCDVVGAWRPGEFAVLDIESNEGFFTLPEAQWPSFILSWCNRVQSRIGGPVVIYMSESPAKGMPSNLARFPLWVAGYELSTPTAWEDWQVGPWIPAIWQWSSTGSVPGVDGPVDMNIAPDDLRNRLGLENTLTNVPGLDHLHPTFAARVANACRARGTTVYSGARSTEAQAELWRRYQAGTGNPANRPGTSWHEYGDGLVGGPWAMAVDFSEPYPHGEPGLIFPVAGEPWHGQPSEVSEPYRVAGADTRLPVPTPTYQEALTMQRQLVDVVNGADYLWLGPERIFTRITTGGVFDVLRAGNDVPRVEVDEATLEAFKSWASNAGFTG